MKKHSRTQSKKKARGTKSTDRYITKLAQDLKRYKERVEAGEKISSTERKNIRARELRVMKKMKKEIKILSAIILAEIAIAIPILVGIYVWSMVAFV